MPCLPQTILNSWTLQYLHATAVSPWTAFPTLFRILLNVHLLHALQLDCYCDTDTYNTWLLIKLTPKGVVFSFSFLLLTFKESEEDLRLLSMFRLI